MAADDLLTETINDSGYEAAVRFYTWDPPAVSLGCHQTPDVIDLDRCQALGWDVVFRPTGGRALLHMGDLCYAVIIQVDGEPYRQLRWLYNGIASAMAEGFGQLGLDAEVTIHGATGYVREPHLRAGVCLDSRVRGELLVGGMKVSAAAQRIYGPAILQHGSILLEGDPGAIAQVVRISDCNSQVTGLKSQVASHKSQVEIRNRSYVGRVSLAEKLRSKSCSLKDAAGGLITLKELVELLTDNFAQVLGFDLIDDTWTSDELTAVSLREVRFDIIRSSMNREVCAVEV